MVYITTYGTMSHSSMRIMLLHPYKQTPLTSSVIGSAPIRKRSMSLWSLWLENLVVAIGDLRLQRFTQRLDLLDSAIFD